MLLRIADELLHPYERLERHGMARHPGRPLPIRPQSWEVPQVILTYELLSLRVDRLSSVLRLLVAARAGRLALTESDIDEYKRQSLADHTYVSLIVHEVEEERGRRWYAEEMDGYHWIRGKLTEVLLKPPFEAIDRARLRSVWRSVYGERLLFDERVDAELAHLRSRWDEWAFASESTLPQGTSPEIVAASALEAWKVLHQSVQWMSGLIPNWPPKG